MLAYQRHVVPAGLERSSRDGELDDIVTRTGQELSGKFFVVRRDDDLAALQVKVGAGELSLVIRQRAGETKRIWLTGARLRRCGHIRDLRRQERNLRERRFQLAGQAARGRRNGGGNRMRQVLGRKL